MRRLVWKKVKIEPALREVFECPLCYKSKYKHAEAGRKCECHDWDEYYANKFPNGFPKEWLD